MVFFSKNKKTALQRIKKLASRDKRFRNKTVKLAENQIQHISGWRTWKVINK